MSFSALQRAEIAEIIDEFFLPLPRADVSVLFNEPKLLKFDIPHSLAAVTERCFSALQRAEIAEIEARVGENGGEDAVSVLFNEPKLLKSSGYDTSHNTRTVSVLFNEPKLLK